MKPPLHNEMSAWLGIASLFILVSKLSFTYRVNLIPLM